MVRRIDGPHLLLQSRSAECAAAINDFIVQVDADLEVAAQR
jgi:hypothetical protein